MDALREFDRDVYEAVDENVSNNLVLYRLNVALARFAHVWYYTSKKSDDLVNMFQANVMPIIRNAPDTFVFRTAHDTWVQSTNFREQLGGFALLCPIWHVYFRPDDTNPTAEIMRMLVREGASIRNVPEEWVMGATEFRGEIDDENPPRQRKHDVGHFIMPDQAQERDFDDDWFMNTNFMEVLTTTIYSGKMVSATNLEHRRDFNHVIALLKYANVRIRTYEELVNSIKSFDPELFAINIADVRDMDFGLWKVNADGGRPLYNDEIDAYNDSLLFVLEQVTFACTTWVKWVSQAANPLSEEESSEWLPRLQQEFETFRPRADSLDSVEEEDFPTDWERYVSGSIELTRIVHPNWPAFDASQIGMEQFNSYVVDVRELVYDEFRVRESPASEDEGDNQHHAIWNGIERFIAHMWFESVQFANRHVNAQVMENEFEENFQ